MSDKTVSFGTTLAGATAGTIGNLQRLAIAGQKREVIDFSSFESPDGFSEHIAGLADAGEITATVNYDGTATGVADKLNTAFQAGTAEVWTITFTDTSTWACSGFITNLGMAAEDVNGIVSQDITIKCTGKPTYTDKAT